MKPRPTRRSFLASGLHGGLAAAVASGTAPMFIPSRAFGANERIVIGGIGVGKQGSGLVRSFAKIARIGAISDVYLPRAEQIAKEVRADSDHQIAAACSTARTLPPSSSPRLATGMPSAAFMQQRVEKPSTCEKPLEYSIIEGRRVAGETGQKLRWDAAAELFTNSDEANRFLSRPARQGYELPEMI